ITISGVVFNNLVGDGIHGPQDTGLAGFMVTLLDPFNNPVNLPGTQANPVTTDATGAYSFTGVGPGTFTIQETPLATWIQTTPATVQVTITSGTDLTNEDFGNFFPITISGVVFTDATGSGSQAAGDPGAQNVEVDLVDSQNNVTQTFTDANGNY